MTSSRPSGSATIVLPAVHADVPGDASVRRWLSRADVTVAAEPEDILPRLLRLLREPALAGGAAALRLWGQTGERPAGWTAAADPVFLEARLDHLCLHRPSAGAIADAELYDRMRELQTVLDGEGGPIFTSIGDKGYLRAERPLQTPALSPMSLHGREPSPFMPAGREAAAFHRLMSEIQMVLHQANERRRPDTARGGPVNALWIWGGGTAPPIETRPLPTLFADDPLLRGYWSSAGQEARSFAGDFAQCASEAPGGFVAALPGAERTAAPTDDTLSPHLAVLRELLHRGSLRDLRLLFANGVTVIVRRRHRWRLWRAGAAPFAPRDAS